MWLDLNDRKRADAGSLGNQILFNPVLRYLFFHFHIIKKMVGSAGNRPGYLSIMSRVLIQRFKLPAHQITAINLTEHSALSTAKIEHQDMFFVKQVNYA